MRTLLAGPLVLIVSFAAAVPAPAQPPAERPYAELPYTPSLDPAAMDRSVDPCVDFYAYSCGGWRTANPIPPDQSRWSVYDKLYEDNLRYLWGLLETAAQPRAERDADERRIGDYFTACTDLGTIERRGLEPVRAALDAIAAAPDLRSLGALLAAQHLNGSGALFELDSEQDARDSSRFIAVLDQGGLGLPDRDYYTRSDGKFPHQRERYLGHVARLLELAGDAPARAAAGARTVLAIESALAGASLTRVERRDPQKLYHLTPKAGLEGLAPAFAWREYLAALGLPDLEELNLRHPPFVAALGRELVARPLEEWRTYLRWHVLHASARTLPAAFRDEDFSFYQAYLRGIESAPPRWKTCVERVDEQLGEALGRVYVERTFPPGRRAEVLDMVARVESAMARRLAALDWMGEETRRHALEKLARVVNKVGYPERWRDYSPVAVTRDDHAGNVERAFRFEVRRRLDRIGRQVDRGEWAMTPPTVNAYYDPQMNDMNFPAGVLQPPLYDARLDDAPNYGNTGGTIGHELIHGFDDEGRHFDAGGNLRDWWTPADDARFRERARCVIDQYSTYPIIDELKINGELTAGEDIADLAGLQLAWDAWREKSRGLDLEPRDGLTPEQRFFVGFAQWDCGHQRPEEARLRALTDPHSPSNWRINGVVVNLPEFAAAFACKPGQPMAKPAGKRCRIW